MSDKTKPFLCLCEVSRRYILQEQGFSSDMVLSSCSEVDYIYWFYLTEHYKS